jgi:protein-tyrosine-phosphatase
MAIKERVQFLCSENSCRTQTAEALLRDVAGDREIVSVRDRFRERVSAIVNEH